MLVAVADLFVCARQAGPGQSISSCLLHSHLMLAHLLLEHHQQPPSNTEHHLPLSLPPSLAHRVTWEAVTAAITPRNKRAT